MYNTTYASEKHISPKVIAYAIDYKILSFYGHLFKILLQSEQSNEDTEFIQYIFNIGSADNSPG